MINRTNTDRGVRVASAMKSRLDATVKTTRKPDGVANAPAPTATAHTALMPIMRLTDGPAAVTRRSGTITGVNIGVA
jgi:hypothetical protein